MAFQILITFFLKQEYIIVVLLIDISDHSWGNGEHFNRKGKDRDSR